MLYRALQALAATTPGTDAHEDAAGRWQRAFPDIDAHRMLQASDAGKGLLAADVWTITATATRHDIEPLNLLTGYLHACAHVGGTAPAGADLDPFLPWTAQGRARRRPAGDQRQGPAP